MIISLGKNREKYFLQIISTRPPEKRESEGGVRAGEGKSGLAKGLVSAIAVIELEISGGIGLGRKHEIR